MLARKGRQELPDSGRGSADLDAQDRCRRLDMDEAKAGALTVDRDEPDPDWDHAFADVVGDLDPRPAPRVPEALGAELRCVSSGYPEHGCSCSASGPLAVARPALLVDESPRALALGA